jgi:Protein of unknown function (DUF3052)
MVGYSGTPLPKKLGLKPKFRIAFFQLPADVKTVLKENLAECLVVIHGKNEKEQLNFAMIFVKSQSEMKEQFSGFARRLAPAGMLWVSWPKKSSGVVTDVTESDVRRIGLAAGLVDVKVCAVTEVWSGLKFVIRVKDRAKTPGVQSAR